MKKIFFIILFTTKLVIGFAQNVGIGTAYPEFKLDVKGGINTDSVYFIAGYPVLSTKGSNTFVGNSSGVSNISGTYNASNGLYALHSNTTGAANTATGSFSLYTNTTASSNTAYGYSSLYYNSIGANNTSTGYSSLFSNTTGSYNTGNGSSALSRNTTGINNTGSGYSVLYYGTTGTGNTGAGALALYNNTTGSRNAAVGIYALNNTMAADGNSAFGAAAGSLRNNGYYNTFLGSDADANGNGYYNSIAIGNAATITAPVQVRIGASFISSIGGYANWTSLSDGRFKKNIKKDVRGLDFIMKLRPVTYNLDVSGISEKLNENRGREMDKLTLASIAEKEKTIYSGFVAQEVEQVAKETGYDFSGVDKPKNQNDFYGLRYAEFVVPLVKAVQEQQQLIQSLQSQIDELRKAMNGTVSGKKQVK
jgi:hypothetical protein